MNTALCRNGEAVNPFGREEVGEGTDFRWIRLLWPGYDSDPSVEKIRKMMQSQCDADWGIHFPAKNHLRTSTAGTSVSIIAWSTKVPEVALSTKYRVSKVLQIGWGGEGPLSDEGGFF